MSLKLPVPSRIPILYVILGVLLLISVVPMYFYSAQVEAINRDRLITNERLLQNIVTRSLADFCRYSSSPAILPSKLKYRGLRL